LARMATLERLKALFSRTEQTYQAPDSSAVRRYVENVAAWRVFLAHPVLGVGPGHFAQFYSQAYGNRLGLIEQLKKYRGHNLYLETLAETGVIGLVSLLAIFVAIMHGLWMERKRLVLIHPELADTATAFFLCMVGYAISAAFAHLSYQRYFWLLLALCSAAIRILHTEFSEQAEPSSLTIERS
jgi:O-antigen ligase